MKKIIGIDLGGTHVRVAKVTETGEVLQEIKSVSYGQDGPEKVLANLIELVQQIDNYKECVGIGLGIPGPVDTENKCIKIASNLPGCAKFPFGYRLEEALGLPTFLDNDANVAGLAEALVGAGKGKPIVYYVTISTGIGGALVVDGKVVSGKNGFAGEIANIIVDRNGERRNNLNPGAIESEASGTAIGRIGKEMIGDQIVEGKDVFDLARSGDAKAIKICEDMAYNLAIMFSSIAHVVDPHIFIIGGGCMKAKDVFFDKMVADFKTLVHAAMADVEFKEAELSEPGIIGAAMLPISYGC